MKYPGNTIMKEMRSIKKQEAMINFITNRLNIIKKITNFFILCLLSLFIIASASPKNPPQSASDVELSRYVGRWYEIASFPNNIQKGCRCTSSDYELQDQSIIVKNRCLKGRELKMVKGKGRVMPDGDQSQLKIQFFWPIKRNYWIIYVDSAYQEAIIGTPDRKYLWFLARDPQISESSYLELTDVASQQGYDIAKLNHTDQSCEI